MNGWMDCAVVSTTLSCEKEANRLAEQLVESALAACVQITGPIRSHFHWKNKTCSETEWLCSCKTIPERLEDLTEFIHEAHPYETPELVVTMARVPMGEYWEWMISSQGRET